MQFIRAPRFPINRPITVTRYWEDMPVHKVAGRCHALSLRGLGAVISDQLYVGEVVRLELASAHGVYASVRNRRGNHYGLEFLCLTEWQDKQISHMCEACAMEQAERKEPVPEARPWR